MNPVHIIEKKRNGGSLSDAEIAWAIRAYTLGQIPDYQMSALLMAVYFQGMDKTETAALTRAMIDSGETMDLSSIEAFTIDKHSTGGVGDKVSLILAPLAAAAGLVVPMMAGRGLGHTGGTLDKLEAIPGYRVSLSEKEFVRQLEEIGCAIVGQTLQVAPADRELYALRDVTGTVPSIPLICSSILSKKKAEGTQGLLLDVKIGEGAFLSNREDTHTLARELVSLGNRLNIRTRALITGMDQPLGNTVGNWLETLEAIEALQGHGPDDLMEVTYALGSIMLVMAGKADDYGAAAGILKQILESGKAWQKFMEMIEYQGGDLRILENPETYQRPDFTFEVKAARAGVVAAIGTRQTGLAAMMLGAGRLKKEDAVDPKAGIRFIVKRGARVQENETLAVLYSDREDALSEASGQIHDAIQISDAVSNHGFPLIECLIGDDGEQPFSLNAADN